MPAQFTLAEVYYLGQGVPQSYVKAAHWFGLAARKAYEPAQAVLGVMYSNGQGVPQDYTKAFKLLRLAAQQDDGGAQSILAAMYSAGQGTSQDYVEADKWRELAKAQLTRGTRDYESSTKEMNALVAMMTPAQIAQARQEASAWFAAHQHAEP